MGALLNHREPNPAVFRTMVSGKIHRATVTGADVDYVGSIAIDSHLLQAADIYEGQQVDVVNVTNGNRLTTYTIRGQAGSGTVQLNGAAALKADQGDLVIIIAYAQMPEVIAADYQPLVVHVDADNKILDLGENLDR